MERRDDYRQRQLDDLNESINRLLDARDELLREMNRTTKVRRSADRDQRDVTLLDLISSELRRGARLVESISHSLAGISERRSSGRNDDYEDSEYVRREVYERRRSFDSESKGNDTSTEKYETGGSTETASGTTGSRIVQPGS